MTGANFSIQYRKLDSISFSRFRRIRDCVKKGALSRAPRDRSDVPTTRALQAGNLFHAMVERIGVSRPDAIRTGKELRHELNAALFRLRSELESSPASRHLGDPRDWHEMTAAYLGLRQLLKNAAQEEWENHGTIVREQRLFSRDGLLFGDVDAYVRVENGIKLIDYKTGLSSLSTNVDSVYVEQLHFYAYLLDENEGTFPTGMQLVGVDGHSVDVPLSIDRSRELADDMRKTLRRYNAEIERHSGELSGNPSVAACQYCSRKPECSEFLEAIPHLALPDWHHVVLGRQDGPLVENELGILTIPLSVEATTLQADKLAVHRVFQERFRELEDIPGQLLLITNLVCMSEVAAAEVEATESTYITFMGAP